MSKRVRLKTSIALTAAVVTAVAPVSALFAAELDVANGASDLTSASSYTQNTAPTTTSDVTFNDITYSNTAFTIGTSLSIATLNDLNTTQSLTIANNGTAADTLTLNGGGTNPVAPNSADLLYVASGGTLTLTGGTGTTALGLSLAASGNLDIAGTATISSIISGSKGLAMTGGGTLMLSGANTFTGGVTISSGTVKLGSTGGLGAAANTTTIANGATLDVNGNSISNYGTITLNGAGPGGTGAALINSGGGLTATAGVGALTLASASTFSSGPNRLDINGTLNAAGFAFTKTGAGYTAMKGATSNLSALNINAGGWEVSNATGLGTNATATVDTIASGAYVTFYNAPTTTTYVTTFNLNGGSLVTGSGSANLNGSVVLGASTTSTLTGNLSLGTSSVISGTGALAIATAQGSAPNVVLSGASTFSGGTTVTNGTLTISNASGSATGSGAVSLAAGVTLASGTAGTIAGNVTGPATGTATVLPGGAYSTTRTFGAMTLGGLAATSHTTLNYDLSTPTASDTIAVSGLDGFTAAAGTPLTFGAVPASAGTYNLVSFSIDGGGAAPATGNFSPALSLNPRLSYTLQETPGTPSGGVTPYNLQLVVTGGAATTTTFTGTTGTSASPADWNTATNWAGGVIGGLQGDTVNMNNGDSAAAGGTVFVNLNGQQHVGTLDFNNTGTDAFTIQAGTNASVTPALYLDNGASSTATVTNSTNNNTISAPVVLFSDSSINVTGAANTLTISGIVSGSGSLTLPATNNLGTVVLSGANSYMGGTVVSGGTLAVNNASALGTGMLTLNAGATIDNTAAAAITVGTNNPQTWAGSFTFKGTQNLSLGGGAVTLTASPTVTVANNTLTVAGNIGGAFGLTKAGPGILLLSAGNNGSKYTGATVVNAGTLTLTGGGGQQGVLAGTPSITVNSGGTLLLNQTDQIGYTSGKEALIINGTGQVLNNGGTSRITIQNTVTMTGGTLGGSSTSGNGAYSIDVGGATPGFIATSDASGNPATISGTLGNQQSFTLNVPRGTSGSLTAASPDLVVSGNVLNYATGNSITKTGNGIMVMSGATNSFAGAVVVNQGTLRVNGAITTTAYTTTVASGATLGGSGSIADPATITGTITAGPNATTSGLFTTAAETWASAGNYLFKLASSPSGSSAGNPSAGGTAATWDEIKFTTLNLTATTASPFTITVNFTGSTFSSTGFTIPIAYSTGTNAINNGTAITAGSLALAATGNSFPPGTSASNFSIVENSNNSELDLVYTSTPEPGSIALVGMASLGLLHRRRRSRSAR